MDILRLLEELQEITVEKPRSVFGLTWNYNREEVLMQISKVRASLPQELKQAVNLTRESERIVESAREDAATTIENGRREFQRLVDEAKEEAARIVEQARLHQQQMLAESEVLKIAKAQAEELRNTADREAANMRRGAENYAYDVLSQLENVVGKVMTTIERGKSEVRDDVPAPVALGREKARVL